MRINLILVAVAFVLQFFAFFLARYMAQNIHKILSGSRVVEWALWLSVRLLFISAIACFVLAFF
jgi:hypothetical protein